MTRSLLEWAPIAFLAFVTGLPFINLWLAYTARRDAQAAAAFAGRAEAALRELRRLYDLPAVDVWRPELSEGYWGSEREDVS